VLAAIGVALAVLVTLGLAGRRATSRQAPALPTAMLAGGRTTLRDMEQRTHGRSFVVLFFASWCPPCRREAGSVAAFAQTYGAGRIIGVDESDAAGSARAFVRQSGWTFPVARDSAGEVGNAYEIADLPAVFVINGRGRIETTLVGQQTRQSLTNALG